MSDGILLLGESRPSVFPMSSGLADNRCDVVVFCRRTGSGYRVGAGSVLLCVASLLLAVER